MHADNYCVKSRHGYPPIPVTATVCDRPL